MASTKRSRKPKRGEDIMARTRAAVCLLNTRPNDEQMHLDAFMTLFHPNRKGPRLRVEK